MAKEETIKIKCEHKDTTEFEGVVQCNDCLDYWVKSK